MNVYIAARNINQAKAARKVVEEAGHTCCARWIDLSDPEKFGKGHDYTPKERALQASTCEEDVRKCDVLVHLSNPDYVGKGGRHFEAGMAFGLDRTVVHVGEPENVFHWHPLMFSVPDLSALSGFLRRWYS